MALCVKVSQKYWCEFSKVHVYPLRGDMLYLRGVSRYLVTCAACFVILKASAQTCIGRYNQLARAEILETQKRRSERNETNCPARKVLSRIR